MTTVESVDEVQVYLLAFKLPDKLSVPKGKAVKPVELVCASCGVDMGGGSLFCGNCGAKVGGSDE